MRDAELDAGSKLALARSFEDLARYALRKTHRDVTKFGVLPERFTVKAFEESLTAEANGRIFGSGAPSLKALLDEAKRAPTIFVFQWSTPGFPDPLTAAFELFHAGDNLRSRLLWLRLPETVPVAARMGIVDGRHPLEEAVSELLRVRKDGSIERYPPPEV